MGAEEKAMLAKHPEMEQFIRDRKCHEVILWFAHHGSQIMQREVRKSLILPLLPERDLGNDSSGVFPPGGGLGCDSAHAKQTTAKNTEYVQWPEEVVYTATGHGAFPFWDNGGPGCSHCDPSVFNSAQIKTLYSGKLGSEIIMHESCGDMSWTGSSGAPNKSPCNHILTPDQGGFIYTPKTSLDKEADGKFCCRTVKAGSTVFTGAVPRDWMKQATYSGTYADFSGDHYSGPIKMFTWSSGQALDFCTTPSQTAPLCSKEKAANSQVAKSKWLVRACYRSYCTMIGQRSRIPALQPLTSRFHLFARLHQCLAPFLVILLRL